MNIRAFQVEFIDWGKDFISIVFTHSPARAKYLAWKSANDAGYRVKFKEIKTRRAYNFDALKNKLKKDWCYLVDFLNEKIKKT